MRRALARRRAARGRREGDREQRSRITAHGTVMWNAAWPCGESGRHVEAVLVEVEPDGPLPGRVEDGAPGVRPRWVLAHVVRERERALVRAHVVARGVARRRGEDLGVDVRAGDRAMGREARRDDLELDPGVPFADGARCPRHVVLAVVVVPFHPVHRGVVGAGAGPAGVAGEAAGALADGLRHEPAVALAVLVGRARGRLARARAGGGGAHGLGRVDGGVGGAHWFTPASSEAPVPDPVVDPDGVADEQA